VSQERDDPRCPECGEPIGTTATYCMHCSADLTDEQAAADSDSDEAWDSTESSAGTSVEDASRSVRTDDGGDPALDPDGIVDNTLTVVVGIAGGLFIGIVATLILTFLGGGPAAGLGLVAWLGSTAYLVRRRTVQGAISKSAYGVALVLLSMPLIMLSPLIDQSASDRAAGFVVMVIAMGIPAAFSAGIGYVAGKYVPDEDPPAGGAGDAGESV